MTAAAPGRGVVAAAVLAAGASRRLGRPKQLLSCDGQPLVRAIAGRACASTCDRVAVVLGAGADHIAPVLDGLPLALVGNPAWEEGVAASVRAAVSWAEGAGCAALLLLLCDQPLLTTAHIDRLVAARGAGPAVASRYGGVLGVPALFERPLFPALAALRGDQGARPVLRQAAGVVAIDWPDGLCDVDTDADARRLAIGVAGTGDG